MQHGNRQLRRSVRRVNLPTSQRVQHVSARHKHAFGTARLLRVMELQERSLFQEALDWQGMGDGGSYPGRREEGERPHRDNVRSACESAKGSMTAHVEPLGSAVYVDAFIRIFRLFALDTGSYYAPRTPRTGTRATCTSWRRATAQSVSRAYTRTASTAAAAKEPVMKSCTHISHLSLGTGPREPWQDG